MRIPTILAAALILASPAALEAQFTTLVPPPRDPQPAQGARVAAAQQTRDDSLRRVQLSDMRAWVDSAAVAIAGVRDTLAEIDSGDVALERPALPRPVGEPRQPTVTFREGAPAPATATGLPLLALLGIGALGIGAVLIGRARA